MEQVLKESFSIKGRYRIVEANPRLAPHEYLRLTSHIQAKDTLEVTHGESWWSEQYRALLGDYHAKAKVAEHCIDNLVPTAGKTVIAQRLAGTNTYTGNINYFVLGSNTTVPALGDTQLGTETYRQLYTDRSYVSNVAYLSCFIAAGSATGTHNEVGVVIDGTASANTGQLFSHAAISQTKSALNSLTIDASFTVS